MEKRKFTQEFKQEAVDYYHSSGKSVEIVSEEMGIGKSTLSKWITNARKNEGKVEHRGSGNKSSDENKEIARLKKELKDAHDALAILKKAMGILGS